MSLVVYGVALVEINFAAIVPAIIRVAPAITERLILANVKRVFAGMVLVGLPMSLVLQTEVMQDMVSARIFLIDRQLSRTSRMLLVHVRVHRLVWIASIKSKVLHQR